MSFDHLVGQHGAVAFFGPRVGQAAQVVEGTVLVGGTSELVGNRKLRQTRLANSNSTLARWAMSKVLSQASGSSAKSERISRGTL